MQAFTPCAPTFIRIHSIPMGRWHLATWCGVPPTRASSFTP